ncbi:MAG: PhnA domain-containing protein [Chitinophagaceae bacterium]|nr:PhnA domain-containing protein [Chitinophagaceae bacterium]
MSLEETLAARSGNACELCAASGKLNVYEVPPQTGGYEENNIYICDKCLAQVEKQEELDNAHWNVLNTSMWSEVPGVQVVSWRMLNRLRNEAWAAESLDMMYMDDERLAWAKATGDHEGDASVDLHRDANGAQLHNGDNVVLTKTLDVKGSTLKASVGTVVRNIHLVKDNTEQIEGRIEGQMIVILTKYVRRQGG